MMPSPQPAANVAATPPIDYTAPRTIQRSTSVFLLSRRGELWRVVDTDRPSGMRENIPSASTAFPFRVFNSLTRAGDVRVYTFPRAASHAIDAPSLQQQLDEAKAFTR